MDREPLRDTDAYLRASASTFYQDENAASPSSFAELAQAFSQRITELQQLMCLRIEDHARHLFVADLQGLEASVRALEKAFKDIREHLARERATIPKARMLLQAARQQQDHLQAIAANLPTHLPSGPGRAADAAAAAPAAAGGRSGSFNSSGSGASDAAAAFGRSASGRSVASDQDPSAAAPRRRDAGAGMSAVVAPRWYVTQAEMNSLAPYMRGRLTLEKVNAALDEAALHAEQVGRWMVAVRAHAPQRIPVDERRRATDMYHALANKEGIKGQAWFPEAELRNGVALRPDKTGKSLLMVLRHLGRIGEVRVNVEALGGSMIVYVLTREP